MVHLDNFSRHFFFLLIGLAHYMPILSTASRDERTTIAYNYVLHQQLFICMQQKFRFKLTKTCFMASISMLFTRAFCIRGIGNSKVLLYPTMTSQIADNHRRRSVRKGRGLIFLLNLLAVRHFGQHHRLTYISLRPYLNLIFGQLPFAARPIYLPLRLY